jgi:hypothetical protein
VRNRDLWAFIVSAGFAASIWALSLSLTGKNEPWDSEGPYYLIALATAGAVSGAIIPRHLGAHYMGAVIGQVAYQLIFIGAGTLFGLGVAFLVGYSGVFIAMVAVVSLLRKRRANEAAV